MSGRVRRVMLVCERLDISGGVERFVCETAADLAAAGMEVAVATVDTQAAALCYPLPPAVRVLAADVPTAAPRGPSAWRLLRAQWRTGRRLAALISRERPDAVVLNGLTTACSVLVFSRDLAPRAICCDHNHFSARSRPWQWLRGLLYPRVAAVVSLTQTDAVRFAALNPRTEVIYNASALRAEAPTLPAEPVVLAVGRHVAQKGLDLLLEAWPAVCAAVPAAQLRIIGEGPLQPALQAQAQRLGISGSVAWIAPTPEIEVQYRSAAVFVLPSRYEGMPLALLEAQALGVPSVAFDCPTGPAEILGDGAGLLVPLGDVTALSQAIVALLQQQPLRERLAHAAIRRSREYFSQDAHRDRWRCLVAEVAR